MTPMVDGPDAVPLRPPIEIAAAPDDDVEEFRGVGTQHHGCVRLTRGPVSADLHQDFGDLVRVGEKGLAVDRPRPVDEASSGPLIAAAVVDGCAIVPAREREVAVQPVDAPAVPMHHLGDVLLGAEIIDRAHDDVQRPLIRPEVGPGWTSLTGTTRVRTGGRDSAST